MTGDELDAIDDALAAKASAATEDERDDAADYVTDMLDEWLIALIVDARKVQAIEEALPDIVMGIAHVARELNGVDSFEYRLNLARRLVAPTIRIIRGEDG